MSLGRRAGTLTLVTPVGASLPWRRPSTTAVCRGTGRSEARLKCWSTGDGAADNPNYRYWMYTDTGVRAGWVNDWYLDTGNPAVWQQRIPHC